MATQVLCLGHPLNDYTKEWLRRKYGRGEVRIFVQPFHISNFSQTLEEVDKVIQNLKEQGADVSGNTETLMVAPGSSIGAAVIVAAWLGKTGQLPKLLNLIRRGDSKYIPSPEKPLLDLDAYADAKMAQEPELIDLSKVRDTLRKRRQQQAIENLKPRVETI